MKHDKIGNPTKYFKHPHDAIRDPSLSVDDKIILYENWLDDIKLKLIAEEENMLCTVEAPKYYVAEISELLQRYRSKKAIERYRN